MPEMHMDVQSYGLHVALNNLSMCEEEKRLSPEKSWKVYVH